MKRKDYLVTGNYFEVYLWLILVLAKFEQSKAPTIIILLQRKSVDKFLGFVNAFSLEYSNTIHTTLL
jgi:hypothetical protein